MNYENELTPEDQIRFAFRGRMLVEKATFDAEAVEELERMFNLPSDKDESPANKELK